MQPAFHSGIKHIVMVRSNKQMLNIVHAGWIVTVVTYTKAFWNRSNVNPVRYAMRSLYLSIKPECTIEIIFLTL